MKMDRCLYLFCELAWILSPNVQSSSHSDVCAYSDVWFDYCSEKYCFLYICTRTCRLISCKMIFLIWTNCWNFLFSKYSLLLLLILRYESDNINMCNLSICRDHNYIFHTRKSLIFKFKEVIRLIKRHF